MKSTNNEPMTLWSKTEEATKEWCHGKVLEISRKWCHWKPWSKEPLILWCNVLWGTNKWLIRDFPKDLGIKRSILATQISSLFDSELRTPSLVYAIIWFSHWSKIKALPRSILRLGRNTGSADAIAAVFIRPYVAAWVLRLKAMSMTCFLVNTVALSGWSSAA